MLPVPKTVYLGYRKSDPHFSPHPRPSVQCPRSERSTEVRAFVSIMRVFLTDVTMASVGARRTVADVVGGALWSTMSSVSARSTRTRVWV